MTSPALLIQSVRMVVAVVVFSSMLRQLCADEPPKDIMTLKGHTKAIDSVVFSPDGKTLASASRDKTIKLWNTATGKEIATLKPDAERVGSVAFSPDGKTLASGHLALAETQNVITLWDAATGKQSTTVPRKQTSPPLGTAEAAGLVYSLDGKRMASIDYTDISLWDVATMRQTAILKGHAWHVMSIAISPDGKTLASGSADRELNVGEVKIWDVSNGKVIATPKEKSRGRIFAVAFSPDGKTLVFGGTDKSIQFWDVSLGKISASRIGHDDDVVALAFSADGKTLASGSLDKSIRLQDSKTGNLIATIKGHAQPVFSLTFSPDGKTLASGSGDGTVKLWAVAPSERTEK